MRDEHQVRTQNFVTETGKTTLRVAKGSSFKGCAEIWAGNYHPLYYVTYYELNCQHNTESRWLTFTRQAP